MSNYACSGTLTRDNTVNMKRIREDQVCGGTLDTKQLTLKILVAKHDVLTFIVVQKRLASDPNASA